MQYSRRLHLRVVRLWNSHLSLHRQLQFCMPVLLVGLSGVATAQAQQERSATLDAASKISSLSCNVFSERVWGENRWSEGTRTRPATMPFSIPYLEWGDKEFNALKQRARGCGDPAIGMMRATRLIEAAQEDNVGRIRNLRRDRDALDRYKEEVFAELSSILRAGSAEDQVKQLEKLRQTSRGRSREIDEKTQAALETAQDRRVDEAAARERGIKLRAAEQEVEEARRAVQQADVDVQLRQQKAQQAVADQAERSQRAAEAQRLRSEQETRMQSLAAENQALSVRRAEQEREKTREEAKTREQEDRERRVGQENAARVENDRIAQIMKRPECQEAATVIREEMPKLGQSSYGDAMTELAVRFQAGMRVEGCALARSLYSSVERMRSTSARCEPAMAFQFNELVSALTSLQSEYQCR